MPTEFASANFDANSYSKFRPTYPTCLFEKLFDYHQGSTNLALDVGCGAGEATFPLLQKFKNVKGVDPSKSMLKAAKEKTLQIESENNKILHIEWIQASAENLDLVANPATVDLILNAECIHWFDHPKYFKEVYKMLRPGGTLAYWIYSDQNLIDYPKLTYLVHEFTYADDYLGPYWQQPGRNYLRILLKGIDPPNHFFKDITRTYNTLDQYKKNPNEKPWLMKESTIKDIQSYIKTWSAFHKWKVENKNIISKAEGGTGDIVDQLFDKFFQLYPELTFETKIRIQWNMVAVFAKKN